MLLHSGAQAGTHFIVEVIRNLVPYLVALHFHCSGHPVCRFRTALHRTAMLEVRASSPAARSPGRGAAASMSLQRGAASCHSPQNPNEPIQCVHCDIWPDSQSVLRKIGPVSPARPEPAGFGARDVPEIRRYDTNG